MKFHCNIHDLDFEYENPTGHPVICPLCMFKELETLRDEYRAVKHQRDVLVEAIGIVKTIQELK